MAIEFPDISFLAEQNPTQYMELLNAMQQIETWTEQEAAAYYTQQMAQIGSEYEVLPNALGHTYINTGTRIAGGYNSPISSTTESALELARDAYDYEVLDVNGSVIYKGNMGVMKTTQGVNPAYQSTSLMSMDVGIVGAIAAPILGVSLGVNLYRNNPKFWTQLSQKLLPFCYPGTTKIPGWLDIVESAISPGTYEAHAVIDKRVLEAVQNWFEQEGIGVSSKKEYPSLDNSPYPNQVIIGGGEVRCEYITENRYQWVLTIEVYSGTPDFISVWNEPDGKWVTLVATGSSSIVLRRHSVCTDLVTGTITTNDLNINGSSFTYENKTVYGASASIGPVANSVLIDMSSGPNAEPANYGGDPLKKTYWIQEYGNSIPGEFPQGTDSWEGDSGNLNPYSKKIIYMKEDPNNPGSFILDEQDGVEVAVPIKSSQPAPEVQSTRPENWPEEEPWPMTVDFPWEAPEGYEEEWPEEMPWPLPKEEPEWWPDVIPYPEDFPMPAPSVDPIDNPNPNETEDSDDTLPYVEPSPERVPDPETGTQPQPTVDPADETVPDPDSDASDPNPPIGPVEPIDPGDPPGTTPPPPDDGETPLPVVPVIPLPWTPEAVSPDGLITVYHPTDAQLKAFASWLWVTYADPSIQKLWNNPFDGVIGLMELYCTPTDVGAKNIRSGFLDSGISSQTISRYTEIDCGSITISEYYGNYLDYSPYSKSHVYLPFIGIVELSVDDIVGHAVNINYKIDEYNGSCIAQITCAKVTEVNGEEVEYSALMYQFSGNCAVELPLAGGTQAAIRAGLIQAAAYGLSSVIGGVVSGLSGNIGGAVSQIGYGAANAISSVVSAKSSVQHSGSFGSSFGALGIKTPYIVVTRPKQIDIINYPKLYGYPAHAAVTIGTCHGYLRVREVNVRSATASDEEKKRIEELLKEGVYVD